LARQINATTIIDQSISPPTGRRAGSGAEQAEQQAAAAEQAAEQADECLLQMYIYR
jgi:hypothetical protein